MCDCDSTEIPTILPATGAVARTVADKLYDMISVKDFGAAGDGVTDDTDAIQAAIDAIETTGFGGLLWFPPGVYKITDTLQIGLVNVRSALFVGAGQGREGSGGGSSNMTVIQWHGETGGTMLRDNGRATWGAQDICFDGRYRFTGSGWTSTSNRAGDIWRLDRTQHSRFTNVRLTGALNTALHVIPQPEVKHDNFQFNVFTGLYIAIYGEEGYGIALKGNMTENLESNCCHNTFVGTTITHRNYGIYLFNADNNHFVSTRVSTFTPDGFPPTNPSPFGLVSNNALARNNYFKHFQGTIHAKAGSFTSVEDHDRSNGVALPTIDAGATLYYTSKGMNAHGTIFDAPLRAAQVRVAGDPDMSNLLSPDQSLFTIRRNDSSANFVVGVVGAPREINFYTNGTGTAPDVARPAMTFHDNTIQSFRLGSKRHTAGAAAPTSGTWAVGDIRWNTGPVAGGNIGWVCTTAGTPGTWKSFGAIAS